MAGKQWFTYRADNGKEYAVMLSKDIKAASGLGFVPIPGGGLPRMPQGMKMRYVNAVRIDGPGKGFMRRRLPVANNTAAIWTKDGVTKFNYGGIGYETTSKRGERNQYATATDTGI